MSPIRCTSNQITTRGIGGQRPDRLTMDATVSLSTPCDRVDIDFGRIQAGPGKPEEKPRRMEFPPETIIVNAEDPSQPAQVKDPRAQRALDEWRKLMESLRPLLDK